jgi:hypothetical protein
MKPIIKGKDSETIYTYQITCEEMCVAIDDKGVPRILADAHLNPLSFKWKNIQNQFTAGNGMGAYSTIREAVEDAIDRDWNIAVFHQSEWRKALQWLIDNGKTK